MTLAATNVGLRYGDIVILRGVSLTLSPGELVALIGPNGAGKSSLLYALSGALAATAGVITPELLRETFNIPVTVLHHPRHGRPVMLPA